MGEEVELEVVGEGIFGRVLAFVFKDELLINRVLVAEGLAEVSDGGVYESQLLDSQDEARGAERGTWSALCQAPRGEGCLIKGNVRRDRGTKKYHLPDCFNYEKIVVNEREGDRWFCSGEEAEEAGFERSEDCP